MARTIGLTAEQWVRLQADPALRTPWMTRTELEAITTDVARTVRVPYLGPVEEAACLVRCVMQTEAQIGELMPQEVREIASDAARGVSEDVASRLRDRLLDLIPERVRLPVLSEHDEEILVRTVITTFGRALRKGRTLCEPDTL